MTNSLHFSLRNETFAVLLPRLDHDTQDLSCLLPQSCYVNLTECTKLGCEHLLRETFLHFAQPGAHQKYLRMFFAIFMFRGTGRSSTGKNGGFIDTELDAELQATLLSNLLSGSTESP